MLTTVLALSYERCGGESFIGGIVWERYVVDPVPGPIKLSEIVNAVEVFDGYIAVNGDSYAIRGGKRVYPQIVNISKALNNRALYVFDMYGGSKGLSKAIESFSKRSGVDIVIGVDVGGDSLAKGYEDNLWSPLADAIGVAALAQISLPSYVAVASLGADGELDPDYLVKRIKEISVLGGFVGGYILSHTDIDILKKLLQTVVTEASKIPILFFDRELEQEISIRTGSRRVKLGLHSISVILLNAQTVARDSVARYVYGARDLYEARSILNELNIYTELDLEEDIYRELIGGRSVDSIDLLEIRRRGVERLVKRHYLRALEKESV